MPELTSNKITPQRLNEAQEAFKELMTEGIHCDWLSAIRTLKFFFEDLEEHMRKMPLTNERLTGKTLYKG